MESSLDSWFQGNKDRQQRQPYQFPQDMVDVVRDVRLARRFGYVVPDATGAHLDWMLQVDELMRRYGVE